MSFFANKEEDKNKEEATDAEKEMFSLLLGGAGEEAKPKSRIIGVYGDIDEETAAELVYTILSIHEEVLNTPPAEEGKQTIEHEPVKLIVSTHGGSAHEMFSIYDTFRMVQKDFEIHTVGLGKVMSAGIVLLAAGTKGKRKVGKNCRLMIHPVASASVGDLKDIENETKEIRILQKMYIQALVDNSNLTESKVKRMFRKKVNTYISAEEAIKFGIADEII